MNIQKKITGWAQGRWYFLLIAFFILLRVFFWFSPSHAEKMSAAYLWPGIIAAIALLLSSQKWKLPSGAAFTLGLTVWLLASCVINGDPYLQYNHRFMLGIVICFGGCYLAIPSLPQKHRENGFTLLAYLHIGLMLLIAVLGIYAAIAGAEIRTPFSDSVICVKANRLYVFDFHSNEVANAFTVGFLLLLYLLAKGRGIVRKLCLVLAGVILAVGIALTVSRTAMLIASAGLGAFAFWGIYEWLKNRKWWYRWLAGLCAFALLAAASYFTLTLSINAVGAINEVVAGADMAESTSSIHAGAATTDTVTGADKSERTSAAKNSGTVQIDSQRRDLRDIGTLNKRTDIWLAGIDYLKAHPKALLFGAPDNVVSRIPSSIGRSEYHMHNAFLEMLLLGGLPGFALFAGFLLILCKSALRLAFAKAAPLRHRMLAVLLPLLMMSWITEIYPLFSGNVMDMMFFVIAGAVVSFSQGYVRSSARMAVQ